MSLSIAPAPCLHGCRIWQLGEREVDEMLLICMNRLSSPPAFHPSTFYRHYFLWSCYSLEKTIPLAYLPISPGVHNGIKGRKTETWEGILKPAIMNR